MPSLPYDKMKTHEKTIKKSCNCNAGVVHSNKLYPVCFIKLL